MWFGQTFVFVFDLINYKHITLKYGLSKHPIVQKKNCNQTEFFYKFKLVGVNLREWQPDKFYNIRMLTI